MNIYNPHLEVAEKLCPKCGRNVDKPSWTYCSRKCANSRGPRTQEFKDKVSLKIRGRKQTQEQIQKMVVSRRTNGTYYSKPKPIKICIICSATTDTRRNTCSKECLLESQRLNGIKSASVQTRRSKQEIVLYDFCAKHFTNISHNEPIANGWDADILLHDHKIAILWNGPWHYRETGLSNHSLDQVVNRDCIKIMEFEKLGWEVLIYQDNLWKPEEALIDILIRASSK